MVDVANYCSFVLYSFGNGGFGHFSYSLLYLWWISIVVPYKYHFLSHDFLYFTSDGLFFFKSSFWSFSFNGKRRKTTTPKEKT